jgi:hypothetical protein
VTVVSNLVSAQLSWPSGYTSYVLQCSTNLTSGWTTIYNGTGNVFTNSADPSQPAVFYRLVRP